MNAIDFCADTNFAIYYLDGLACVEPYATAGLAISVVTQLEVLSKPGMAGAEEKAAEAFLQTCQLIELTDNVKQVVIALRRQHQVKLPDAIVAATALWLGVPLLTADKGFSRIAGLDVVLLDPA